MTLTRTHHVRQGYRDPAAGDQHSWLKPVMLFSLCLKHSSLNKACSAKPGAMNAAEPHARGVLFDELMYLLVGSFSSLFKHLQQYFVELMFIVLDNAVQVSTSCGELHDELRFSLQQLLGLHVWRV